MKKGIALHTYANPVRDNNNSRLLRIVQTLGDSELFDNVCLLCVYEKGQKKEEKIFSNVLVKRIPFRLNSKKYALFKIANNFFWLTKIITFSLFKKIEVVSFVGVVELLTLPYFRFLKNAKVIYYADDIATENRAERVIEKIFFFLEKTFLRYCDGVIVVSEGIKGWYEKKFCIDNVHVIWNAPTLEKEISSFDEKYDMRKKYSLGKSDMLFGYVGTFTTGRSLEKLLEIFEKVEKDRHLILAGYGELQSLIEEKAKNNSNIHYFGAIPWDKIISFSKSIDIGLVLLEDVSLNYRYALPTKLFQYLASETPILVTDLPDMANIVKKYGVGWEINEKDMKRFLKKLSFKDLKSKEAKIKIHKLKFLWLEQREKLINIYQNI